MRQCAINPGFVRFFLVFCLIFGGIFVTGCGGKPETPPKNEENTGSDSPKTVAAEARTAQRVGAQGTLPVLELPEILAAENQMPGLYTPQELDAAFQQFLSEFEGDTNLEVLEPPAKVVYYFIRALQVKDEKVIYALLTQAAREERVRQAIPLGPDGCENATVNLGNVQYVEDPDTGEVVGARVGTVWVLPDPENPDEEFEEAIAWVLGKESDQRWGIAGMVAIIDLRIPPVLVNFENIDQTLEDMVQLNAEIEEILKAEAAATAVETPGAVPPTEPEANPFADFLDSPGNNGELGMMN